MIVHNIPPVYDKNSRILILGSFPSVKSRDAGFFYGHPQNRFWKVISSCLSVPIPLTIEQKKEMLLSHRIAVWDVIWQCEIEGSADSTIRNVIPNNISVILDNANIKTIIVNGKTAEKFYIKYLQQTVHREAVCMPSTSPANAVWSIEKLVSKWKEYIV